MDRLFGPEDHRSPLSCAPAYVEVFLAVAAVVVAVAIPTPEGAWASPWMHAGGAATAGLIIAFWARGLPRRSRRIHLSDGAVV